GFTLVELIVVIVIIAILAGVLIPTFGGIIERARVSNDTTNVTNMNKQLGIYKLETGLKSIDYHTAYNVIVASGLTPTASSSGNSIWYDTVRSEVKLANTKTAIEGSVKLAYDYTPNQAYAETTSIYANDVSALSTDKNYLYFDFGDNVISNAIKQIRSYADHISTSFATIIAGVAEQTTANKLNQSVKVHLDKFDPATNPIIYISQSNNTITQRGNELRMASNIVFDLGVTIIPSAKYESVSLYSTVGNSTTLSTIKLPDSVKIVCVGAFSTLIGANVFVNNSDVLYEQGAINQSAEKLNNIQVNVAKSYSWGTTVKAPTDGKNYAEILPCLETAGMPSIASSVTFDRTFVTDCIVYVGKIYDSRNLLIGHLDKIGYFTAVSISKGANIVKIRLPYYTQYLTNLNDLSKYVVTLEKTGSTTLTCVNHTTYLFTNTEVADYTGYTIKIRYNDVLIYQKII
ncbi:MAG: prepilin-type N-terminal cleavage/methylation domain-containing protein, partial [Clostridia bacterium]